MQLQTIKKLMLITIMFYISGLLLNCGGNNANSQNTNPQVNMDPSNGGVADGENSVSLTPIIVLAFSSSMNPSSINSNSITLTTNPNSLESSIIISNLTSNESNSVFSFNSTESLSTNTKYYVIVNSKAKTTNGLSITGKFSFTTGAAIFPMASILNPNNLATDISRTPSIQIKFSSSVIHVDTSNLTLHESSLNGTQIELSGITSGSDNNYVFSPSSPLNSQTIYYIVLSSSITDTLGNSLNATSFSFKTGNSITPSVSMINPSNGGVSFPINPNIQIQFSESVNDVSLANISLVESSTSGRSIALKTVSAGLNNSYIINPTSPLSENTIYYIVLESGISNNLGNHLPKTIFYFTTSKESNFILVGEGGVIDKLSASGQLSNLNAPQLQINSSIYGNNKFVAVGSSGIILNSTNGANWALESSGKIENLFGVTYANGLFVIVGSNGITATSNNGVDWRMESSNTTNSLITVTYGNNKFVASGAGGIIVTSNNGSTWNTESNQATVNYINNITYANDQFIAVGELGTIITSHDGTNWSLESSKTNATLRSVTSSQSTIVAVGSSGTILTSNNGISWSIESSPSNTILISVTYGNGQFVAVGQIGLILNSNDGINWTIESSGITDDFFSITYGNGTFIAFTKQGSIVKSIDGVNWITVASGQQGDLFGVTCSNNKFAAAGANGTIMHSNDGNNWAIESNTSNALFFSITYAYNQFITVGVMFSPGITTNSGFNGVIFTSNNGHNWALESTLNDVVLSGITYGAGKFITVGGIPFGLNNDLQDLTQILSSTDGITWSDESSGLNNLNIASIIYGNGLFAAIGIQESSVQNTPASIITTIITSTNGVNWSSESIETSNAFAGITYGNGLFVAVGNSGVILISPDGINWASESSGTDQDLRGITYGGGQFVASGSSGTILSSYDGVNWNTIPKMNGLALYSVCAY